MDQTFHTGFQFHKRAVGNKIDNLALDLGANGILGFDIVPRIGELLFEAEADAFLLAVDVEHHHVNVLADLEDFRGMTDVAPACVRDMQQTVNAVEVNERAEIRDVLDCTLADVARRHFAQEFRAAIIALLLDEFAAGQNDVLAFLVDLDDLELVGIADKRGEVLEWWCDINLRDAGQRNASTPMLTRRPPLTTALTLPVMVPPSLQIVRILSQFCLNSAFSLDRMTMPSFVLRVSR